MNGPRLRTCPRVFFIDDGDDVAVFAIDTLVPRSSEGVRNLTLSELGALRVGMATASPRGAWLAFVEGHLPLFKASSAPGLPAFTLAQIGGRYIVAGKLLAERCVIFADRQLAMGFKPCEFFGDIDDPRPLQFSPPSVMATLPSIVSGCRKIDGSMGLKRSPWLATSVAAVSDMSDGG
jgi:hypothetical protein